MEVIFDPRVSALLKLREKALKDRNAAALYQLATIYAGMKGNKKQKKAFDKKAFELYRSSATQGYIDVGKGYADAWFMMGLYYEKGIGVKQNAPYAVEYYMRAETSAASDIADHSEFFDEMQRERLHIFCQGPNFAEEMDDAAFVRFDENKFTPIEEIFRTAEEGDPEAQDRLGHCYYCGSNGVEKDPEEAAYWFRKSAEQGCGAGIHHLAQYYKLSKQYKEAVKWYRNYAEMRIKQRNAYLGW